MNYALENDSEIELVGNKLSLFGSPVTKSPEHSQTKLKAENWGKPCSAKPSYWFLMKLTFGIRKITY